MDQPHTYTYTPLPAHHIRVLHLDPAAPDSPLTGTLRLHPLPEVLLATPAAARTVHDADLPPSDYDCVSYVWGTGAASEALLLRSPADGDGADGDRDGDRDGGGDGDGDGGGDAGQQQQRWQQLSITASLASLLRRLRKRAWAQQQGEGKGEGEGEKGAAAAAAAAGSPPLCYWADAVCINQEDPVEKAAQVALMPVIYRGARRVVVDLGEERGDVDHALWLMSAWWKKYMWDGVSGGDLDAETTITMEQAALLMGFELADPAEREALEAVELPDPSDSAWGAVARFFARPWFERVWVVQEFVLARDVLMICGEGDVPWRAALPATVTTVAGGLLPISLGHGMNIYRQAALGLMAYHRQARLMRQTPQYDDFLRARKGTWLDGQGGRYTLDLYGWLDELQGTKATRRRDKCFALAGLADDVAGDEPELRPDYVSPIETVVARVGRWLWKKGYGVPILLGRATALQSGLQIPSWALDFLGGNTSLGRPHYLSQVAKHYDAAKNTQFHVTMTPGIDHLVTVSGMFVDSVVRDPFEPLPLERLIQQPSDGSEDDGWSYILLILQHLASNLRALLLEDVAGNCTLPAELSDIAIISALCFGGMTVQQGVDLQEHVIGFRRAVWEAVYRKQIDELWDPPFPEISRMLEREFGSPEDEVVECAADVFLTPLIMAALRNPQLTRTRRGRVANLPSCFQKGDQICIVRGVSLPLLLRRSTEYPGCYQFLGQCYVHGIMHGEALELGHEFEQVTLC